MPDAMTETDRIAWETALAILESRLDRTRDAVEAVAESDTP